MSNKHNQQPQSIAALLNGSVAGGLKIYTRPRVDPLTSSGSLNINGGFASNVAESNTTPCGQAGLLQTAS